MAIVGEFVKPVDISFSCDANLLIVPWKRTDIHLLKMERERVL